MVDCIYHISEATDHSANETNKFLGIIAVLFYDLESIVDVDQKLSNFSGFFLKDIQHDFE